MNISPDNSLFFFRHMLKGRDYTYCGTLLGAKEYADSRIREQVALFGREESVTDRLRKDVFEGRCPVLTVYRVEPGEYGRSGSYDVPVLEAFLGFDEDGEEHVCWKQNTLSGWKNL